VKPARPADPRAAPPTIPLPELNELERKFVDAYFERSGNATAAYIDAGGSPAGAHQNAHRLQLRDHVRAAMRERYAELRRLGIVSNVEALTRLARIARGRHSDTMLPSTGRIVQAPPPKETQRKALETFLKIGGVLVEKKEITGRDGGPVNVRVVDPAKLTDEELDAALRIVDKLES
jgi:phage terminase small subunit